MDRSVFLPFVRDARLRTMPASRIVDHLVLHGWPRAVRNADPEGAQRKAGEALARWRALGLPWVEAPDGSVLHDPGEVFLAMRWAGRQQGDPFWRPHHVDMERARVLSFHPPGTALDTAPAMAALPPRRFTVTVRRRFHPAYLVPGARLRLPLPYPDAALHDVDVRLEPVDVVGDMRRSPGYAELRLAGTASMPVTLGARCSFVALPWGPSRDPAPLSAEERELYLRHSEELVHVTPGIVAMSRELAQGVATPMEAVARFYDYLLNGLNWGPFPYESLDAREPLNIPRESGWFDCRLGSAMLVAMCRVAGIPARRASGYLIYPECAGYHWWTEAWMDGAGWVPFDTWGGELSASGQDAPWRNVFFGALDYRYKSEVLPRAFNRSPGVRMPPVWRMLERDVGGATEIAAVDLATQDNVWTDTLHIEMGEAQPA